MKNSKKGFSSLLGILLVLVILGGGLYIYKDATKSFCSDGDVGCVPPLNEKLVLNGNFIYQNGSTNQFEDGVYYLDCDEASDECNFPDEAFKNTITEVEIINLDDDEEFEAVAVLVSTYGEDSRPSVQFLEYEGDNNFSVIDTENLPKGLIKSIKTEEGQVTFEIDTSWMGGGIITHTIKYFVNQIDNS